MADEIVIKQEDVKVFTEGEPKKVEAKSLSDIAPTQSEIEIDPKEKLDTLKVKVNYKDKSYLNSILDQPTEKPGGGTDKPSNDDVKARLLTDTPNSTLTKVDSDESDSIAELIVEIVDWILVAVITWFSKDKSDKEYETDNGKKKILKKYLSKFLVVKQKKYPVEFFLIAAFLSTYFISARKAYSKREENIKLEAAKKSEDAAKRRQNQSVDRKKRSIKDGIEDDKKWEEGKAIIVS